ncbi:hypothetical protein [Acaryochloris marina]|uniref:Uncharacterized protein n=1 Tax=Acaryochloris marina (strain MBIC 11017) TaxID=329726 RepID=A8ZPT8_ACAM1|nr:hypothetical protein [Acaryochloris marina]ABW33040.1 hypothetical protein AM1_F0145 [Acaryochloris marina MBIC11017]
MKKLLTTLLILSAVALPSQVLAQNSSIDASCIPETGSRIPVEKAVIYATTTQDATTYHYVVLHPKDLSQSLGVVLVEVTGGQCKGHLVDFAGNTLPFEQFVPAPVAKELVDQATRNWNNRQTSP